MSTPVPPPIPQVPPPVPPAVGAGLSPIAAALLAAVAPAPSMSRTAIVGGLGASGVVIYVVDRLLANDGQLAASMLTKLSPLLGPVWASWPVILVLVGVAIWAASKWGASQKARAAADYAIALGLENVAGQVATLTRHVDTGFGRLDAKVAELQVEVSTVTRRVDVLEAPPIKRRASAR